MMKKISKILIFAASVLLYSSLSAAQSLPSLPADPSVSSGTLPDRIQYYLVSNPTHKGKAEFSLVWRLGVPVRDTSAAAGNPVRPMTGKNALAVARKVLAGTGLFSSPSPVLFLRRNGVQGPSGSYIYLKDKALVFRFSDVNLNRGEKFLDSLLLLTFDFAREYSAAVRMSGVADCGQAIIISGDIDKGALLSKMELLSLFVPDIGPETPAEDYRWIPGDSLVCRRAVVPDAVSSGVTAEYSSPRVPAGYMGTVLPVMSEQMGAELGLMLERRLAEKFARKDIPVSRIGYRFKGSASGSGDETFSISARTLPDRTLDAVSVMSSAISEMAASGVSLNEYAWARQVVGRRLEQKSAEYHKSNGDYVEKCISSFLYGSSVVSASDRYAFFAGSALPDSSGLDFFNRFASSMIDSTDNLTLTCVSGSGPLTEEDIEECFRTAWHDTAGAAYTFGFSAGDTSRFDLPVTKCKIARMGKEPVSGGASWVFANGMKVIYKQLPTGGRFRYSMIFKGGFSSVPGLKPGQGAFFADMFSLYRIAGVAGDDLKAMLSAKGISMKAEIAPSYMKITGSSSSESLPFLLKFLSSMSAAREMDTVAFRYYAECEKLRLEERAGVERRLSAIDSIICPDFRYSGFKSPEGLTPDLQSVADGYFRRQLSKFNDGVLLIVGDLEEDALKKTLQSYIGSFPVDRRTNARKSYSPHPVSGGSTYIVDGRKYSLDLVMSASIELDAMNYMASEIAAMVLKDAVISAVSGGSAAVRVSDSFTIIPSERLNMSVSVEACDTSGFAAGTVAFRPVRALFAIRSVLKDLSETSIPQGSLDIYKATLKNALSSCLDDPEYWMETLSRRVIYGKDFHTDYQGKIDAVTADMVREIILSLDNGTKVEYIVRPKIK